MRKLNLKWLLGLLIGTVSLTVIGYFLHSAQVSRNASAYVREAKRAEAEKRSKDAIDHMRRYIKLAPNDAEGWVLFGKMLKKAGRTEAAFFVLEETLRKWPERSDVREDLVDLSITLHRYADAMDQLNQLLARPAPEESGLREKMGDCQIGLAEYDQAEKSLETAIATGKARLEAYVKLAVLRKDKLSRPGDADEPFNQMVLHNPDLPRAYYLRTQWLLQRANELKASARVGRRTNLADVDVLLAQATADMAQALKLTPDDSDQYGDMILMSVKVAHEANHDDDAKALARRGIEVEPNKSRFYLVIAELEIAAENPDGAVDILRQGTVAVPNDLELKWLLADFLIEIRQYDEATTTVQQLRAAKHPEPLVDYLDGKLLIHRGDVLKAIRRLDSARAQLRGRVDLVKQIDFWLGMAYRELKSPEQEVACFRRSVAADPDWIPSRMALAESLMKMGFYQEAVSDYRMIASMPATPVSAVLGLAKAILISNLRTKEENRSWFDFDSILAQFEKQPVVPFQFSILRMERLLATNQRQEAVAVISEARKKYPNEIELMTTQIGLAQLDLDWEKVEQLFREAEESFGDQLPLRLQKGRYLVQRHAKDAPDQPGALSPQLQALAEPPDSWLSDQRMQLANGFVPFLLAAKEYDAAEKLSELVRTAEPQNLSIRLLLLEVALRADKPVLMQTVLDEIQEITGQGSIWNYGQAVYRTLEVRDKGLDAQVKEQKLDEALIYLKKARSLTPSWERIPLLSAEILEAKGMTRTAADQYIEAINLGERRTNVISNVLALLFFDRRFEDAEKLIQRLHDVQSTFSEEMARAEVDVSLQLGRKKDALRTAEQLVLNSKLALDPIWLGQVFLAVGKNAEAERQFRRAIELTPKDPKPWIGLVKALKESGAVDKAEITIDDAKSMIDQENMLLAAAKSYEILEKTELARLAYQAAVDQAPDNLNNRRELIEFLLKSGDMAEAEVVLRKLIEVANETAGTSPEEQLWAQRKLATVLMIAGGPENLEKSLKIVERNLSSSSQKSSDDERLKANILANRASQKDHKEAKTILEKLLAQGPTGPSALDDRFLLARLYLLLGDRTKARNELQNLIRVQKDEPSYLNAYAQLSLQAGETNEAELYLNLLNKLVPNELSTIDLQVQILHAKGRYAEIANLLKEIGEKGVKGSRQAESAATSRLWAAKRLEEFARLLTASGKTEEASRLSAASEYCYEKFVLERPDEMLVLAEFLGQTTRIDRALDLLQEHGPASAPVRVASVAMAMIKNPRLTKVQSARLQQLVDASVQSHDQSLVLQIASAEVLSWRGEYRAAITAYKKLLENDERSLAILNNLAVLTSLTEGNHAEALRLLQKAIDQSGPINVLLDSRGLVHLAAGSPEKAVADFQLALMKSETAEIRFHLAVALAQLKQFDVAQESLDRADSLSIFENELHPLERTMLKTLRIQLKANARSDQTTQTRL